MEINFKDYLTDSEVKEIVQDELRIQIRLFFSGSEENKQRLLSNLAYSVVREEIDTIVPNYHEDLVNKVSELLQKKDLSFHVFNFDHFTGVAKSYGAKVVENTVKENTELIKSKVIEAIQNKDYTEEALIKLENLSEEFTSNIYNFVELIRKNNE